MKGTKKRATAWIVGSAVYATVAAIAAVFGFYWAVAFVPLVCMLCAAACFELGRDYQFELYYDKEELKEEMERMEAATGIRVMQCRKCNGMAFRMVAGRFVCTICGEVLEVENGETEA